jgi:hypothetical protein
MSRIKNHHADHYAVAYRKDGEEHWLETHHTEGRVLRARDIVNDHEVANGRTPKFYATRINDAENKQPAPAMG